MKYLVKLVVAIMVLIVATTGNGFGQNYIDNAEMPNLTNGGVGGTLFALNEVNGNTATIGYSTTSFIYAGTTVPAWNSAVLVTGNTGTPLFTNHVTATTLNQLRPMSVNFDANGAVFFGVRFQDDLVINGVTYTPMGISEIAIIKYSSTGAYQSHRLIQAIGGVSVTDLEVTSNGNIHMVGNFEGTLYVDNISTGIVSLGGSTNAFVLVVNSVGQFISGHEIGVSSGSQNWCNAFTIEVDVAGADIIGGNFKGANCSFGNGYTITPAGYDDYFVAKYDGSTCEGVFKIGSGNAEEDSFHLSLDGDMVFANCQVPQSAVFQVWNVSGAVGATASTMGGNQDNAVLCWLDFSTGTCASLGVLISTNLEINVSIVDVMDGEGWCEVQYSDTLFYNDGDLSQYLLNGGNALLSFDANLDPISVNDYEVINAITLGVRSIESSSELFVGIQTGNAVDLDFSSGTAMLPVNKRGIARYNAGDVPTITAQPVNTSGCVSSALFVEVTAEDADSYQWNHDGNAVTGATNSILWFDPSALADDGDYFCELTNTAGTINTDTVTVVVNALPTPIITGDTVICDGATGILDAGSYSSYLWNTGATTQTIDVTTAGTYSVDVTNSNSCTGTDDVTVVVNPLPTPTITGDTVICAGETGTLDAGNYSSYLWNTGATTQTIDVTTAGTYSVTVTNSNSCEGTDDIVVVTNPLPTPSIAGDTPVCEGTMGTYITGTFDSYSWSIDPASAGTITSGQGTSEIDVDWSDSGDVLLDVTNSNGCTGSTSFAVTVNDNPVADAGVDQSIPYATSTTLDGSATGGDGSYTYSWTPADMVMDPTDPNTETVVLTAPQIFILEVADGNGCVSGTDDVFIDVIGGPLGLSPDVDPEATCGNAEVQLSANAYGGTENYTYSWTSDPVGFTSTEDNPSDVPTETTTYICEVNDGNTTATGEATVTVYDPIETDAGPDMNLEIGQSTQFDGSYTGGSSDKIILWEGVNNSITIDDPSALNPNVGPFPTTDVYYFTLTVTDNITGCESTDTMFVDVVLGVWESSISNSIKIYPNPTSGNVFIDAMERPEIISITNMTGNEVIHLESPKKMTQIDLSSFPSGMYFLGITFKSGYIIKKIDKK